MKKFLFIFLFIPFVSFSQSNYNLSLVGDYSWPSTEGSDIWGWTDSSTQKEYAIAAMTNSTAFVDITDPVNPIFLGRLDSNANNNF